MRTLSIIAFVGLLLLWGTYFVLKEKTNKKTEIAIQTQTRLQEETFAAKGSLLSNKRRRELDKIGSVINEDNVKLDDTTKEKIKSAKNIYENKESVKDLQALLEQSYMDNNSSIKDIKRIQSQIIEKKNKSKEQVANSERWDPRFVYYLMLQENYTYAEINLIKSLAENGLNIEEVEYINELVREESFMERINAFKAQGEVSRAVASFKKPKKKEVDDFIDDVTEGASIEDKLIEMNYNQEEKEEMIYGNNQ